MRVLITGCEGQVGTSLVKQLKGKAIVKATCRNSLDITKLDKVIELVNDFYPDVIINAAAYTAVDQAESESEISYKVNRDGPKNLALAAKNIDAIILHISTDYVFSGDKLGEYDEDDITEPKSIYGKSKLAGEKAIIDIAEKHIILRTAWVFSEKGNSFVKTMLNLGKRHNEIGVVGDQFGGPTYSGDIAKTLILFAQKLYKGEHIHYGVYHYSGLPHVSWYDFANEIFQVANRKGLMQNCPQINKITTSDFPTPAKRPPNSKLNTDKISNALGIVASNWKLALDNIEDYQ
ncbi:dTDP-4-dehydrorhamnose reductase [Vibrio coralliilyticus]|uniref:dTDP-4-dehydrorhamnose reductase n=1 Tax=Vibrio coralliilyticus TaxID=190893 RepID=UPI0015613045|nr:dTDP-4-dehydrorhamnose reductase [Vibrio coralliilyticus]NRF32511.1 dTDP-4-dehydrorhamnose reductase [Vibrio coralliilyticus]NRF54540.1 dTDP-4-dehydrorhamnose reductase [Vibrio coralliilyticus]